MSRLKLIILLFIYATPGNSAPDEIRTLYDNGEYTAAIQLADSLEYQNFYGFSLFYNRACAHQKLGETGMAILYYKKALLLKPQHEDAIHNLNMVRELCIDKITYDDEASHLGVILQRGYMRYTVNTWLIIAVFILFLAAIFKTIPFLLKRNYRTWNLATIITLPLFIFPLLAANARLQRLHSADEVVILVPSSDIREAPGADAKVLTSLHEGTTLEITGESEDWYEIKINKTVGWILKDETGTVGLQYD
jgi:tetratricopeptide (TPR) repeat protein